MALEYVEISSNYTRKKRAGKTIEDIARNKPSRKHKKRHSVEREKAKFEKRKKEDMEKYIKKRNKIIKAFNKLVKAYWNNEIQNYPSKPTLPKKPRYDLPVKTRVSYK